MKKINYFLWILPIPFVGVLYPIWAGIFNIQSNHSWLTHITIGVYQGAITTLFLNLFK